MKSFVLSLIGIVFASILLDLLVGKSKNEKYIKGVFALISLYIIINPIVNFLDNLKNENVSFEDIYIDKEIIMDVNQDRIITTQSKVEKDLKNLGYNAVCKLYLKNDCDFEVIRVDIILDNFDINNDYNKIVEYLNLNFKNAIINIF